MRRYVIAAVAAPAVLWLGFIVIGRKRADDAGNMLVQPGTVLGLPRPSQATLMAVAGGLLLAYVTK